MPPAGDEEEGLEGALGRDAAWIYLLPAATAGGGGGAAAAGVREDFRTPLELARDLERQASPGRTRKRDAPRVALGYPEGPDS